MLDPVPLYQAVGCFVFLLYVSSCPIIFILIYFTIREIERTLLSMSKCHHSSLFVIEEMFLPSSAMLIISQT